LFVTSRLTQAVTRDGLFWILLKEIFYNPVGGQRPRQRCAQKKFS